MASHSHILLFGSEQQDIANVLHDLSVRARTRPQLARFISASTKYIREAAKHNGYAHLSSIEDLVELAEQLVGQRSIGVELALLSVVQIGQLIVLAEDDSSICSSATASAGFGSGLIAAAVAQTSKSVESLTNNGLTAVAAAFRLGAELQQTSRNIENSDRCWTYAAPRSQAEQLQQQLSQINAQKRSLQRAYVGQILPEKLIVYGPPSTFDGFEGTTDVYTLLPQALMYGPHIPAIDAADLLGNLEQGLLRDLLVQALTEIAHKRVNVDETLSALTAATSKIESSEVVLTTFSLSWDETLAQKTLTGNGHTVRLAQLPPCPMPFGNDVNSIPSDAIAVVGMSGRFPESDTLDELWDLLMSGTTTHKEIPSSRFNIDDFYDPSRKKHNALVQRYGCFIKTPGVFDHRLFNISPREAMQMDPVQRMLLMTTYEALEMAGYSENSEQAPPKIATYFGQTIDDWKTIDEQQGIDTHFLPAVNRGFAPGRLCHYFKWAGGFYSIDTGCSSSATGICIAKEALTNGTCDAAVVGGGTLLTAPEWFSGLGQGGFLSPTGACKTYTDQADGYCRGEGVAVVVLKRLADAVRDKDNVLAVIAGAARNTNAGEGSITHPGAHAQEALYRRTIRQAGIRPHDIDVVEMHGTGTQAGDKVETTAVRNVFAPTNGPKRSKRVTVGALKANIGHSEAAAGLVSMMKAILMLHRDTLPPQANAQMKLNPNLVSIFGPEGNMQIARGQPWVRTDVNEVRYVFVNNFDAAGGNVSMVVHDTPAFAKQPLPAVEDKRKHHIVVVSSRTDAAQTQNKARLAKYLSAYPQTQVASLAYSSTGRRLHHSLREAYVVTSTADLCQKLAQPKASSMAASSVVFAFTGQGSQYLGMGGALFRSSASFRRELDSYQGLLTAQGIDSEFLKVILASEDVAPADSVKTSRDMQVATVALEIALARYWQSLGIQPTLLIGHSLGEYAALCIAGVLSVGDALALAYERAKLIFTNCPPSEACMLAVALPAATVQWRIRDRPITSSSCEICCVNGPNSTVVGGPIAAIDALEEYLKTDGNVSTTRLRTQHAFHTRQMDPILDELEAHASRMTFHAPTLPIASTLLAEVVEPGNKRVFNANYIRRHTREAVSFFDTVRACENKKLITGSSFAIEIGPHPTCINLMATSLQGTKPQSFPSLRRGRSDWETLSTCLAAAYTAQLPVKWSQFHKDHLDEVQHISDLPTYAFDLQEFWTSYRSPAPESNTVPHESNTGLSKISTTSVHAVASLIKDGLKTTAVFTSDLADPQLFNAIMGHVVDGVAICPASIFIDMAMTAASYLDHSALATKEMTHLNMTTPLVLRGNMTPEERPRISIEGILDETCNTVSIRFLSKKEGVTAVSDHGNCIIQLKQAERAVTQAWSRMRPLIKARMHTLETSSRPRQVHAMDRHLFYKIFSEIVDYSSQYHAVEEAIVASSFKDASFVFQLPPTADLGTFTCSPFLVDAAVHVAGFLLNADVKKAKDVVHIANHIGSIRVLGDLSATTLFHAYATVREQDTKQGTSFCDVYVTDSQDNLVVLCSDICFKKLDRDFFALLTGSKRAAIPTAQSIAPRRTRAAKVISSSSSDASSPASTPDRSPSLSSQSDAVDYASELFDLVVSRSGISHADLRNSKDCSFADMGVDSQMSIQILSDFQKATAVELPAAFFTNFPTPADVEKEFRAQAAEELDLDDIVPLPVPAVPTRRKERSRKQSPAPAVAVAGTGVSDQLFRIVGDALGCDNSAFTPTTTFSALGLDSMLSIKTLSQFQQETDIELPAAFFTEFQTVAEVRKELDGATQEAVQAPEPVKAVARVSRTSSPPVSALTARDQKIANAVSRAVLIQGSSRSKAAPLFMTTDGSGTVESYIHLSALPEGRRLYALESPFLLNTDDFDLSIEEMAIIFVRTIKRIQPKGPYLIGGWSAGSVYAYEVAHSLTRAGEDILGLTILDMRAPSLIPTAIVTPDFVETLGTFEGINRARDLPEDLSVKEKAHLMSTCKALSRYDAPPFAPNKRPKHSSVVWARLGLDQREDAPPACMLQPGIEQGTTLDKMDLKDFQYYFNSWFYGKRDKFGKNGWEKYLGDDISVYDVDGDHFSMMVPPFSSAVGQIVVDSVKAATAGE